MKQPACDVADASWERWAKICIFVGTMLRLGLSLISHGSNDAGTWLKIAEYTRYAGILQAYSESTENNHPLIPVYWSQLAGALGGETGFYFVFRLASILADAGSTWVAARLAARLGGPRAARLAAAAVAFSPIAILISGYHCNTDSCYAFLCLLSATLLMRQRFFAAGLALGGAINVKLIPILLVPLAFSLCRSWRQAGRLLAGLALCVLPFIPLLLHPLIFQKNVLRYTSLQDRWGVFALFFAMYDDEQSRSLAYHGGQTYLWLGRVMIVSPVLLLAAAAFAWRRWSALELYLSGVCLFFVFTPGFGMQYLTLPVSFLAACNVEKCWQFGVTAGLFAGVAYAVRSLNVFPLQSAFVGPLPSGAAFFGVLTWGILIQVGATTIFRPDRLQRRSIAALAAAEASR